MQGGLFAATAPDLKFSAHTEILHRKIHCEKKYMRKISDHDGWAACARRVG
jgi:hypothetical protein